MDRHKGCTRKTALRPHSCLPEGARVLRCAEAVGEPDGCLARQEVVELCAHVSRAASGGARAGERAWDVSSFSFRSSFADRVIGGLGSCRLYR